MTEFVEIEDVELVAQTDKAGLFRISDDEEIWIPWSQMEDNNEDLKDGFQGSIYVTEWFAQKKEWI